jgi:hypothetical protein
MIVTFKARHDCLKNNELGNETVLESSTRIAHNRGYLSEDFESLPQVKRYKPGSIDGGYRDLEAKERLHGFCPQAREGGLVLIYVVRF